MENDDDVITRIKPEKNYGGVWVTIGMEEYRIPPLGFRALQDFQEQIESLGGLTSMTRENLDMVAEIVHAAISRNYPSKTLDDVKDALDIGNYRDIFNAALKASGYRSAPPGEVMPSA